MKSYLRLSAVLLLSGFLTCGAKADTPAVTFDIGNLEIGGGVPQAEGWQFNVNSTITVTALGWFDDDNSISENHPVGLFDSSGNLLASANVDGTGTQVGFFNYTSITPITLTAGTDYQIQGIAGTVDPYAYAFGTQVTFYDPRITWDGSQYAGQPGPEFPLVPGTNLDPSTQGYFGPSFLIADATPPVPEPSSLALLGTGLAGTFGLVRRRFNR